MFDPVSEPSFRLHVAGLRDGVEVLAFTGKEAISEPFVFDLELMIEDPALDLSSLLYRSAVLHFGPPGNCVHGQLHEIVQCDHGPGSRLCRVRLGPRLACLGLRISQRLFSDCPVRQILDQVLKEHGIAGSERRFEFNRDHPPRDFCTQYRESDLQFLQRLCARERLHFHFEQTTRGHCVVFSDDQSHFQPGERVQFRVEGEPAAVRQLEIQRSNEVATPMARGCTDLATLRSARLMPLSGHPESECNQRWLLTHVEHFGSQDPVRPYHNRIRALPEAATYEPLPSLKPGMHSLQRAWVVDVDEPCPHPDRPVPVQFDWLYQGEGANPSHCWLPLAPQWHTARGITLREGTELVVSFVDGDPDRPQIAGLLHVPTAVESVPVQPLSRHQDGIQQWLCSQEPLLLLCLLPGGGSFHHCDQAVCACRIATRPARSAGA